MPELSFLDLYETNGELHQKFGTLSVEDLLAQRDMHQGIRAFTRALPGNRLSDGPLSQIATLQSALLRAVNSLAHGFMRDSPLEHYHRYFALDLDRYALRPMAGQGLRDNVDVWLRNLPSHEALVEVKDLDQAAIESTLRELRENIERLQRSYSEAISKMADSNAQLEGASKEITSTMEKPSQTAAKRRADMASRWLTAAQVSEQLGSSAENGSQAATQRRKVGAILGVWVPSERAYRYPNWQFKLDGQPVWQMAEILRLLRENGGMAKTERRTSGWSETEWFLTPHVLLDDRPPAEMLIAEPDRVLKAARTQFEEDNDAGGF